jgi:hypothetical protein
MPDDSAGRLLAGNVEHGNAEQLVMHDVRAWREHARACKSVQERARACGREGNGSMNTMNPMNTIRIMNLINTGKGTTRHSCSVMMNRLRRARLILPMRLITAPHAGQWP